MEIFSELEQIQKVLLANRWNELEPYYFATCVQFAPAVALQIAKYDLSYYQDRQFDAYCKALKKAKSAQAQAIYFEYDLDNDWDSHFYICPQYTASDAGNDDWASRWVAEVRAYPIPEFSKIYRATDHFCQSPTATAITIYLIARTTASLCELVKRKSPGKCKICIGFHDQDPLHRLADSIS